jgi:hypothetical protein
VIDTTSPEPSRFSELPFYPLLLAVFIPVNLLAQNISLFSSSEGMRVAAGFLLAAVVVSFFARLLVRQKHAAALLTALLFAGIWVYQFSTFWRLVYVGVVLLACVFIWRRSVTAKLTLALNLVMLAIILQPLFVLSSEQWRLEDSEAQTLSYSSLLDVQPLAGQGPLPVVVHILVDGYASNEVLSTVMGFDNSPFEAELEAMGFNVAGDVRTPYNQTLMVMSSIFSGEYLRLDQPPFGLEDSSRTKLALGWVVSNGPVKTRLDELGYRFLYTEPGFNFWQFSSDDIVSAPPLGPFTLNVYEQLLLERTGLNLIPRLMQLISGRPNYKSARLSEVVRHSLATDFYKYQEPPYMLYEHVLAPHPPFNVDRYGVDTDKWPEFGTLADGADATLGDPALQRLYKNGYLEKLRYVNTAILEQLRVMIRDIPSPKVIMVHGDHGGGAYYFPDELSRSCLKERYSPFLAVYTDDPAIRDAFAHIKTQRVNLVNLYRIIFDARFGAQLGLLPDKSWFASWENPESSVEISNESIDAECLLLPDSQGND